MAEKSDGRILISPVARIRTDFPDKFGLPRQSGIAESLRGTVVFEPEYRNGAAFRGLEGFSHIWLIWGFSRSEGWSPTVRPPRLGGNRRMGVFATRSPFRPNPIGLSCVKLDGIDFDTPEGPVLRVSGADMTDGTPIYDVKPYLPYADSRPDAESGFAGEFVGRRAEVEIPDGLLAALPEEKRAGLREALAQDPRPAYQDVPGRVYGFVYAGTEIKFTAEDGWIKVTSAEPLKEER